MEAVKRNKKIEKVKKINKNPNLSIRVKTLEMEVTE
jgi:hypothetical protein